MSKPDVSVLIKRLKELPSYVKTIADESISENREEILFLNKKQLQVDGVDADGDSLGEYSAKSKSIRQSLGLQTDHIDLRLTGKFQESFVLKKRGKAKYEMTANDPKWTQSGSVSFKESTLKVGGNTLTVPATKISRKELNSGTGVALSERFPDAIGLTPENQDKLTVIITRDIDNAVKHFL